MNKKISLIFLFLLLGLGSLLKAQTITLTVCGNVQSPNIDLFNSHVNMELYINGILVNSQLDSLSGIPTICFDAVDVETNGASELNYTVITTIESCSPSSISGLVNSSETISVQFLTCSDNCSANITNASAGGQSYALQANASGVSPLTYLWSNGSTTSTIPLISPGTYSLTITDSTGCVAIASYTTLLYGGIISTLNSDNTVSLEASIYEGFPPYSYAWNNGSNLQSTTVNNIPTAVHCVNVTDAIGSTITLCDTISPCEASIMQIPLGAPLINLQAFSTGLAPFVYLWNTGETSQLIQPSISGTYSVTVTDALGCSAVASTFFDINSTCSLSISTVPISDSTYMLTANPEGVPPFSYLWYANGSYVTTPNIEVVQSGIYCCQVTDANGCSNYVCDTVGNCAASIIETIINPSFEAHFVCYETNFIFIS
jgi:hypothetical protein